jgi:hypothetical protein
MSKVLVLMTFVICVVCASYAALGHPPSRMGAASGWACAAVVLAVASARMRL